MRIPAQSGTGTARSEAEIVYFVHTPKRPAPSFAAASSPPNRRGAGLLCTRLSITRSPPFKSFMIPSAHHCTTGSAPSDADRGLTEPHETTEPRRRGRWWLPESRGPGASPGLPCSAVWMTELFGGAIWRVPGARPHNQAIPSTLVQVPVRLISTVGRWVRSPAEAVPGAWVMVAARVTAVARKFSCEATRGQIARHRDHGDERRFQRDLPCRLHLPGRHGAIAGRLCLQALRLGRHLGQLAFRTM